MNIIRHRAYQLNPNPESSFLGIDMSGQLSEKYLSEQLFQLQRDGLWQHSDQNAIMKLLERRKKRSGAILLDPITGIEDQIPFVALNIEAD